MSDLLSKYFHTQTARNLYRIGLLVVTVILSIGALVLPIALRPDTLPIKAGDVSLKDIIAPRSITYVSEVLIKKAKDDALRSVQPVYLPADQSISRAQLSSLDKTFSYISSVRSDAFSSFDQKVSDLTTMAAFSLTKQQAELILNLTDQDWTLFQNESNRVLEQIMRRSIQDNQVQNSITDLTSLINLSFSQNQVDLIKTVVSPFVVANSLYSEQATENARLAASDAVSPIKKTITKNQSIILRGQIITEEQVELLQIFGMVQPEDRLKDIISTTSIVLVLTCFITFYFTRRKISPVNDLRSLTIISIGFLVFLFSARFIIPNRVILPYFFPIPAYALILVTLFNLEIGTIFTLVLSILVTYGLSNSLDLTLFYLLTSLFGALVLGKGKKVSSFLWSGIIIGIAGSAIIIGLRLTEPTADLVGMVTLFGATFLNGFASASLALLSQYFLSQMLGIPTPLHLLEVSRPDHPLLKQLLRNAPGTYQHSLQVMNLAERAAEAIGADTILTRVGTIFHDVGKSANAMFFIENQMPGNIDAHDNMDPVITAQTIIQHVTDGVNLGKKYRIPGRLIDFILEHHGTQITRYQYNRALEKQNNEPSKVDAELFKYPGPKPRSRETGILMLADGCEARARAEVPKNDEELKKTIQKVFDSCINDGQLENTNLTLKDLKLIQESFFTTLSNAYHPRIQYPEVKIRRENASKVNK